MRTFLSQALQLFHACLQMTSIISTAAQAAYSVATYILAQVGLGRNVFIAEGMEHLPGHAEKVRS